jgi:hypothetical protein
MSCSTAYAAAAAFHALLQLGVFYYSVLLAYPLAVSLQHSRIDPVGLGLVFTA